MVALIDLERRARIAKSLGPKYDMMRSCVGVMKKRGGS